jgi:hypothetical protein
MSDVLFQVTTEGGTLTRERSDGTAEVYSDVSFLWEADRDGEGPPVPYDEGLAEPGDLPDDYSRQHAFIDSLFTLDEALAVIDWLHEHEPGGVHEMTPYRLPVRDRLAPRTCFSYSAREGTVDATVGDLALRGSFDLKNATFDGLKKDGEVWREVTLSLPKPLADWIERHPDPAGFLATMHGVSEALEGHSPGTFEPAPDLPF